ncbi:MAG: hypothetical protein HYZ81_04895 [Nitrospinae bacterium]|nr:hypothetical protein [Nitrospinota bacterium]
MLETAWAFVRRDFFNDWGSPFSLLLHILNIGLAVASYVFLSHLVERESLARWAPAQEGYFPFVLIGMPTSGAMVRALTGFSQSFQPSGALKRVLLSQTRLEVLLRWAAELFPLTHALEGMRMALLVGASLRELLLPIVALSAFNVLMVPLGLVVFKVGLGKAQVRGTFVEW